jgi:hypothetical protein
MSLLYPPHGPASQEMGSIQVASTGGGSLARGRPPSSRRVPVVASDRHAAPYFVSAARYKGHAPHSALMALKTQEMSE